MHYTLRTILLVLILLQFAVSDYFGQSGNLHGTVVNKSDQKFIEGVIVSIPAIKMECHTNHKGIFKANDIPVGIYEINLSAIGYRALSKLIVVEEELTSEINFEMVVLVQNLPEFVVAGTSLTANGTRIKEISGSAHYISPKEIEKFSYTDINHTLRTVPGINLQEEDGFGLRPNIGIRGTGVERSAKITVMEDGVLAAPAPYAAPSAYYFPTIGLMEGVEILKGSSQIKYGPYTTGGAINLMTKSIPGELSGKVDLLGGSYGGTNVHAFVGNTHGQIGYGVESFNYTSNGFKTLPDQTNTGFNKSDYRVKLRWVSNNEAKIQQAFQLKLGFAEETSNETYLGLTESDFLRDPFSRYSASQKDQMITEHRQLAFTHNVQPATDLQITTTIYRNEFERNWYKLDKVQWDTSSTKVKINAILSDPILFENEYQTLTGIPLSSVNSLFIKANNRSYYSKGIQSVLSFVKERTGLDHSIELGFRFHEDQIDRFQWVDTYQMSDGTMMLTEAGLPGTESNRIETARAFASYLQYDLKIKSFVFSPGLRYEHVEISREDFGKEDPDRIGTQLTTRSNMVDAFIPGISVNYAIDNKTSAFVGAHRGFAPPGSREDTQPEQSTNYEMGYRFEDKGISGEIIAFYSDYSNLLGSDLAAAGGAGTNDLFNGGEAEIHGLESQLHFSLLSSDQIKLPVTLVYTYTDAYFNNSFESDFDGWGTVNEGDNLPYLSNHQIGAFLSLEHEVFSLNFSGKYLGEMRTEPGQGEIPSNKKTDAILTLDASANYSISDKVALFTNVINLTNEVYIVARRPAGLRPGMPRAYNFGIKARF